MAIPDAVAVPERNAVRLFLTDCSVEIVPSGGTAADAAIAGAPKGTRVYVTSIPGHGNRAVVEASVRLRKANFEPIPHVAARSLIDFRQLDDLLARLRGEANVDSLLLLGGDVSEPAGSFVSSRAMLETGAFSRHDFRRVGFATYPEPHPRIAQRQLESELAAKLALSTEQGLESWLVSQLCFAPDVIIRHAERLRSQGISAPLHVGFAGPTSWKGMLRFAAICGVSNSARSFSTQASRVGRLLAGFEPSEIVGEIAAVASAKSNLGLVNAHFFTFGGAEKTIKWINSFLDRGR